MIPVLLTKIKTRDGINLDGIYVAPKRKSKNALIWLHGLTSYFHSSQTFVKELSSRCTKLGFGYFKFDTRGHDLVTRGQGKNQFLGTLFEEFRDCVFDIKAMVNFAKRLGYKNIILAGHSTGANKAVYYLYRTRDHNIKGIILIGGLNDINAEIKRVGEKEFEKNIRLAERLNKRNPHSFFTSKGFLFTPRRYLSLHRPGTAEDVFPYYNPGANWKELKSVRVPIAVIIGSKDEYLDRPAKKLIEIFQSKAEQNANSTRQNFSRKNLGGQAKSFSGIIIKNAGHGFYKKEKELAGEIINWIKRAMG